jgi:putative zinc finger/helix-turn-helix YgiT family protein
MNKRYCDKCHGEVGTHVVDKEEEFPVKGEPIRVKSRVRVCDECGDNMFDEELDSQNLENAFAVYRARHGIISPSEIKAMREKYGLSQQNLARLLGWGDVTITRYEKGSIPDSAHNMILNSIEDPVYMKRTVEKWGSNLSDDALSDLEHRINELISEENMPISNHNGASSGNVSIYTGLARFSLSKLQTMMIYFASQAGGVFKTKLNKLLFYADFLHFRQHRISISGATYIHLPYGPVPDNYSAYLDYLMAIGCIRSRDVEFPSEVIGERLESSCEADLSGLPETAMRVLEAVHQHFKDMGSKQISELSHNEEAYLQTKSSEPISYEFADRLKVEIPLE